MIVSSQLALGQSDRSVTTVRERPATVNTEAVPGEGILVNKLLPSEQPRYYLDTIDTLTRSVDDSTRIAPGLTKNNYVGKIYPVYNTNAIEIQSYLLRTVAYEGGIVEVMGASDVSDGNGAAVQFLYVTAPDFMIPGITEIVETSDRPGFKFFDQTGLDFGGGAGAVQYIGKHRTASELVSILGATELGNVGVFLFPPFADDSTNSIYIVENPTDIADDIAALEMFDKAPLQVEIEVRMYEIAKVNRNKVGVDWDAWKQFLTGSFTFENSNTEFFFNPNGDASVYSTLLSLDAQALTEFLNYTVQTGTTRQMLATRITMVNSEDIPGGLSGGARGTATGSPAVISTVRSIPYSFTASTNDRAETVTTSAEEGVTLSILPFIATESITLDIDVVVASLSGFTRDSNIPLIDTRTTSSVVNLEDGEYLVLGGMKKSSDVKSRVGIPGLKDIPVIRYLFSKEVTETDESEIMISIRPVLVSPSPEETVMANYLADAK